VAMVNRRGFLLQSLSAAVSAPASASCIDLHFHVADRSVEDSLAHCRALGVNRAVLRGGTGQAEDSPASRLLRAHPGRFVTFTREDPRGADAPERLRAALRAGAIGIGEQKTATAIDGPEMRKLYDIAAEHRVPVVLHIGAEDQTGYRRLPAILKQYPSVTFIGHAMGFWGHISADYDGTTRYPTGPVKPGGLTDRWLSEYPNLHGDLSARSGLNTLTRDTTFARGFLRRHGRKLLWGTDCACKDGKGTGQPDGLCLGQASKQALAALLGTSSLYPDVLAGNAIRLLHLDGPR
jgi:predicted TIM-barrel fold metal-dependent hydrolase